MRHAGSLFAASPAKVGMNHPSLNGTGAHDGDLDHQIVKATRLHARQHGHLCAALDLEHPDGVGLADRVVHELVLGRNFGESGDWIEARRVFSCASMDELEGLAYRSEHAEALELIHRSAGKDPASF